MCEFSKGGGGFSILIPEQTFNDGVVHCVCDGVMSHRGYYLDEIFGAVANHICDVFHKNIFSVHLGILRVTLFVSFIRYVIADSCCCTGNA